MDHGSDSDIHINESIWLPAWEVSEKFVRASGPGGQNVNKVSTAVQLRWNVTRSTLPPAVKARFKRIWKARLTQGGDIIIDARSHRSQALNREAARKRLVDMITKALTPPKRRIPTRPGRGAIQRRIDGKKRRSNLKSKRGRVKDTD